MSFRMVRNVPAERWLTGTPQAFAPRYDVEEVDDAIDMPVRVLAWGVPAETARRVIARAEGSAA